LFPDASIAAVYRHSQGLPRLINTICENALIVAYANGAPNVTPEIIGYVARELRLDVVYEPAPEKTGRPIEIAVMEFLNVMLDAYSALRSPAMLDSRTGGSVAVEVREREPYI